MVVSCSSCIAGKYSSINLNLDSSCFPQLLDIIRSPGFKDCYISSPSGYVSFFWASGCSMSCSTSSDIAFKTLMLQFVIFALAYCLHVDVSFFDSLEV